MENLADDPGFIDAIVHVVKSQGLFDQFRKECLADVDTKPAYQNLRQRVESSVSKFLSQEKWIDNIRHKNHLREKLRRNIIGSGYLDTGVERIVDQVVNPKISTIFHPKVEEIVYNYLGVEKPKPVVNGGGGLDVQTDFLPEDLEAVSPDSDKKSSSTSSDIQQTTEQNVQEELNESKEHIDDFESPAFEPLELRPPSQTKHENSDSNASAISGLTSQESVENESNEGPDGPRGSPEKNTEIKSNVIDDQPAGTRGAVCSPMKGSPEMTQNDSQLSQVSSNSRLSIITSSEGVVQQQQHSQSQQQKQQEGILANPRLDITEEAQMPNFHENSNEEEGELVDSNDGVTGVGSGLQPQKSNFDLRQEAYEFKGTERNRYVAVEMEEYAKEAFPEYPVSVVGEGTANNVNENCQYAASPARYEDNSSHSERSLRICEDSTLEQRVLATSDQCDSEKTPLNDEHSTESAPDVDKMNTFQVEVVNLAAVQQHTTDRDPKKDRQQVGERESDRKHSSSHRSSSSKDDRRSHGSSKHTSCSSSRKSNHQDRKHENGNGSSNNGSSRKSYDKRKDEDDHYSAHEKSVKRRRSTDRDSNDGAENGKTGRTNESCTVRSSGGSDASVKHFQGSDKRDNAGSRDNNDKLNDSLDSSFEGFDEEQLYDDPRKMEKITKALAKSSQNKTKSKEISKAPKKSKKINHKAPKDADRKAVTNMDVFAFSFEKPLKLGKNGEICHDEVLLSSSETEDNHEPLPTGESIEQLEEGVIVLEPTELAKIIKADEQQTLEGTSSISSIDDDLLKTARQNFPQANPDDLVTLAIQPVVVDQMLTNGDNMDLELLIGEKQLCGDEITLNKIQQGLDVVKNKVKKPKIASNFNEARKLMKVRRQIERNEKKKREQAMVLAKRLITENGNGNEDDQGVELEFVCDGNGTSSGPIISSPVRQKTKPNFEEETELLYFPEECQIFATNDKMLEFLKLKTNHVVIPDDFIRTNDRLFSLGSEGSGLNRISPRNIFPEIENEETMTLEVLNALNCPSSSEFNRSGNQFNVNSESPRLSSTSAISIDSVHDVKRDITKPDHTTSESKDDLDDSIPSTTIDKGSSAVDLLSATQPAIGVGRPAKEKTNTSIRISKSRRLGLPKPKSSILHGSSTAILTVDISDVKPIEDEKDSPGNNNNGIIKAQRYSSNDLYKPRPIGSRTRTRTTERVGI